MLGGESSFLIGGKTLRRGEKLSPRERGGGGKRWQIESSIKKGVTGEGKSCRE